jgi:hypothetical protein
MERHDAGETPTRSPNNAPARGPTVKDIRLVARPVRQITIDTRQPWEELRADYEQAGVEDRGAPDGCHV